MTPVTTACPEAGKYMCVKKKKKKKKKSSVPGVLFFCLFVYTSYTFCVRFAQPTAVVSLGCFGCVIRTRCPFKLIFHQSTPSTTSVRADASERDELCYCCGQTTQSLIYSLCFRWLRSFFVVRGAWLTEQGGKLD